MDLRHLRCFVAVAEESHVGRAAARLHLTPSPVSRAVGELERELGVQLLIRNPQGVSLSAAGVAFLPPARTLLDQADRLELQGRALARAAATSRVRLGLPLMATPTFTELAFAVLAKVDAEMDTNFGTSADLLSQVRSGELDAAVVYRHYVGERSADVEMLVVAEHDLYLACSPGDALASKECIEADDLADRRVLLITPKGQPDTTPPVEQWLRSVRAVVDPVYGTDLVRMAQAMRDEGGITVCGAAGAELFRQFGMAAIPIGYDSARLQLLLVTSSTRTNSSGVAQLVAIFGETTTDGPWRI